MFTGFYAYFVVRKFKSWTRATSEHSLSDLYIGQFWASRPVKAAIAGQRAVPATRSSHVLSVRFSFGTLSGNYRYSVRFQFGPRLSRRRTPSVGPTTFVYRLRSVRSGRIVSRATPLLAAVLAWSVEFSCRSRVWHAGVGTPGLFSVASLYHSRDDRSSVSTRLPFADDRPAGRLATSSGHWSPWRTGRRPKRN